MGAALVCCQELRQDQLEYLANLPETLVIREEGVKPLFLKHKMPLTEEEIKMVKQENMSIITAHTHEANDEDKDGILLFNPGSIGLPDEGIQGATYGVLESNLNGDWDFTIRDVSYDYFKTITSLKEHKDIYDRCCGWGKALELSVSTGINCTALYSFEANRLARLVEEAKQKGEEPNLNAIEDLNYIFSQGRYGNTNYDNSQLVDTTIEDAGDAYVFGPTKVITSPPSPKGHKPTKEIYDIALNNIKKVVASANREVVYYGRHESILK